MEVGQSSDVHSHAGEDEGDTVEIKIKTLDAQSYTLRVRKNTPVPTLKDQIATVVGVPVENQRLICRGKVLKDDQVLAAYNVEDGHTLHLVARHPPQPLPPSSFSDEDQVPRTAAPSDVVFVSPRSRPSHVSHSLLMGTINIPDSGEGGMPDINRIMSAVLNSVGISNPMHGATGLNSGGPVAVGALPSRSQQSTGSDGQPRSDRTDVRINGPLPSERIDSIDDIEAQLQLDAIYGVPSPGGFNGNIPPNPFRIMQQPVVVPDALTTMSQYLDRLEQAFSILESARGQNVEPSANESVIQNTGRTGLGQTTESLLGRAVSNASPSPSPDPAIASVNVESSRQDAGLPSRAPAPTRHLPTPLALGRIVNRVQSLFIGQAGTALSRLAAQLENEPNLVDSAAREGMQRTILRDGNMMQQLGALLLELGRSTLTLRLGQSPAESVINTGPAVFISPSGPNPMMVQSLPLQTGVAVGTLPSGPLQENGGVVGPSLGPRSINIHIHTSDLRLPSPTLPPQPPRTVLGVSSGASTVAARQRNDQTDAANPEQPLTVRQIIERAEAANGGQPGPGELNSQVTTGSTVQGAIMTFNENGAMRVVPVRTRTTAVPLTGNAHVMTEGDSMFQPLLARFQQQVGTAQHGRPSLLVSGGPVTSTNISGRGPAAGEHPPQAVPTPLRAQVHIQAWRPSLMQALTGGSPQLLPGAAPVNDTQMQPVAQENETRENGNIRGHGESLVAGVDNVDISQIATTLGPFLNQLAVVIQQGRTQPPEQPLVSQTVTEGDGLNTSVPTTTLGDMQGCSVPPVHGGHVSSTSLVENPESRLEMNVPEKMDVGNGKDNALNVGDLPGSSSSTLAQKSSEAKCSQEGRSAEGQVGKEPRPANPPNGLGLGGLQPLPARSRRRTHHPPQVQTADVEGTAAAGNGLSAHSSNHTVTPPAGQNLLQSLVSRIDRSSNRPDGISMEQSLGQLTQGLLPLISSTVDRGIVRGGEEGAQLGEILGQLMSRSADESLGEGAFSADMLRGMMGQLVQSPIVENLVQQVMASAHNEEEEFAEGTVNENGNCLQRVQGGLDFAGIVQQMLPVVSQMFGGRPTLNAGQQVSSSSSEGDTRDGPSQASDSRRWREALSEEEAMLWGETISADVEQQQRMAPQRPFSDIYVQGSPLAKRQKTDMEGVTRNHENGSLSSAEDTPGIFPQNTADRVSNASTNAVEVSQLGHVPGAYGGNDAYMAVLFHDLAARVAADPDFGDGSEFSSGTRILEQQTPSKEPAGG